MNINNSGEYKENFKELIEITRNRPIILFLGAGINANLAPDWTKLLNSLLLKAVKNLPGELNDDKLKIVIESLQNKDVYYKASVIKQLLGEQYLLYLEHQLYAKNNFKRNKLRDEYKDWKTKNMPYQEKHPSLLFRIAELCQKKAIHSVVTYNYDEYLSVILNDKCSKRNAEDVFHYKQEKHAKDKHLLIYHVHGFIPSHENLFKELPENIVLAYDEYFQNMMEPYSWQTATQLHFLMNYTCVFIGASLKDWNMLRMLSNARKYSVSCKHFVFFKDYQPDDETGTIINRLQATVLEESGINIIYAGKSYKDIYEKITELEEIISSKKEN